MVVVVMGVGSTPIRNREEVRSWVESSPESGMSEPLPLPQALPRAALSTLIFLHLSLPQSLLSPSALTFLPSGVQSPHSDLEVLKTRI